MKTKIRQTQSLQLEPRITEGKSKAYLDREERSTDSQKGRRSTEKQGTDFSDKPSPLDFDAFVPWLCMEWQCSRIVTVTRATQEAYKKKEKRSSSTRSRISKIIKLKLDETEARKSKDSRTSVVDEAEAKVVGKDTMGIKAVYDTKDHLVEVVIIEAKDIPRKLIRAIAVCLPFHSLFTRLTIRRGGVTSSVLHDIGTLLPPSNITDVYINNCFVPEGNFYVLLEQISQLRNLSLNHCRINDEVCDKLVSKIEHGSPGSSLLILDLGSNCITDIGAKRIGQVLRRNRTLLHLNLSNNKITDVGAMALLSSLAEFPLSADEIINIRKKKFEHARYKIDIYNKCLEEVSRKSKRHVSESSSAKKSVTKFKPMKKDKHHKTIKQTIEVHTGHSAAEMAESIMKEIVGDFIDPFDSKGIQIKNNSYYGIGNLSLCSLNLAYNELSIDTVKKIYEVLKYQDQVSKEKPQTGLMRVVFDGNRLPIESIDYNKIQELLRNVIYMIACRNSPLSIKRNKSSPIN